MRQEEKCMDNGEKWEESNESMPDNTRASKDGKSQQSDQETEAEDEGDNEQQEPKPRRVPERAEAAKVSCKQPLPGFHQAFGSTGIGKFSRSEFFTNMVNDSGNVSSDRSRSSSDSEGHKSNGNSCASDSCGNYDNLPVNNYYNEDKNPSITTPCWHSPYVTAISSEI